MHCMFHPSVHDALQMMSLFLLFRPGCTRVREALLADLLSSRLASPTARPDHRTHTSRFPPPRAAYRSHTSRTYVRRSPASGVRTILDPIHHWHLSVSITSCTHVLLRACHHLTPCACVRHVHTQHGTGTVGRSYYPAIPLIST